jgi:two-component system sensor histidine kinase KdpD
MAGAASAVLWLSDVTLTFADVALFLVVVAAAFLGYAAGIAAAVTAFVLLIVLFTPPIGAFHIRTVEDLLVFVVFVVGAVSVGVIVARLNDLRRRSARTAADQIRLQAAAHANSLQADLARSRAGFLTAVTHDLQTPLSTITAATAALLAPDSTLDAHERHELLEIAHAESSELSRLVKKVLELTRIRAEAIAPRRIPSQPVDIVAAATARARRGAPDITLSNDVTPDLAAVLVDPVMTEEVLVNLLENAAQHSPAGQSIEVRGSERNGVVELAVVDHGPGIPPAERDRVFDEFVRLGHDDRRGMGLGLAISRSLAEANDGTVVCTETPGGGATFVVRLPRAAEDT